MNQKLFPVPSKTQPAISPMQPAPDSQVHHSPALGRLLAVLAQTEQQKRDLQRERELARLREIQQYD